MSRRLPRLPHRDSIRMSQIVSFGGLRHTPGAGDGTLWDMKDLQGDSFPVMSPRPPRHILRKLARPNGIFGGSSLYWVDGTTLYRDGRAVEGVLQDSLKQFAALGNYLIIWPDRVLYDREKDALRPMEAQVSGTMAIKDGTFAGKPAKGNTIHMAGANWEKAFAVDEGITISGSRHPENNKTAIVREISGDELRFSENCFTVEEGEALTLKREIPDMDHICVHENRLWGCKGDMIYASRPGQPWIFQNFEGTRLDSWWSPAGSAGDFTACASLLGCAVFFKEETVHKVYGTDPFNFKAMQSVTMGVQKGSHRSPAIAGETMFYLGRSGIAAYAAGLPRSQNDAFGPERFKNAVGGSDGERYFVSMEDRGGRYRLYVLDTRTGLWYIEDDTRALGFAFKDCLYCLSADGTIWADGRAGEAPEGSRREGPVRSMAELADLTEGSPGKKGVTKLLLRVELLPEASLTVELRFDGAGRWEPAATLRAEAKRSFYLPIVPRRADHFRIRLRGVGEWRLYSLAWESYGGSALREH